MLSSSEASCLPPFIAHSHPVSDALSDNLDKDNGDDGKRSKVTLTSLMSHHPELLVFAADTSRSDRLPLIAGMLLEGWVSKSGSRRTPLADLEEIFVSLLGHPLVLPFGIADVGGFCTFRVGGCSWRIFYAHGVNEFPDGLRGRVLADRENRSLGFTLLRLVLDQHPSGPTTDPAGAVARVDEEPRSDPPPLVAPRLPVTGKTMKRHENISKISSFFSVVKKNAPSDKVDFFPPFQLRPDSFMASANPLAESDVVERQSATARISPSFKHVLGSRRAKRCTCYGIDGSLRMETWKLLQFWEDYRPAYYGTLAPRRHSAVASRRPFAKDTVLIDYDNDSEGEWAEGALECADDGESITGSDEEDDDEEDDEGELTGDSEDDGWLVPDGYLSEGEGVDEPSLSSSLLPAHPNPDFDPESHQEDRGKQRERLAKKKLVVLKTKIHGPWISNGPSWSLFDPHPSQELSFPFDPFLGADQMAVPARTEFNLSKDMVDYIREDLSRSTSLENLMDKLTLRFGKLPKKSLERRLQELLSSPAPAATAAQ